MGKKTFYGPFRITEIRSGPDFTQVWMKPHESRVFPGPQGQRPLTAVGMTWPCGCEVRGSSLVTVRTSRWAPCADHRDLVEDFPECHHVPPRPHAFRSDSRLIVKCTSYPKL
jgi:hypothetical protein